MAVRSYRRRPFSLPDGPSGASGAPASRPGQVVGRLSARLSAPPSARLPVVGRYREAACGVASPGPVTGGTAVTMSAVTMSAVSVPCSSS